MNEYLLNLLEVYIVDPSLHLLDHVEHVPEQVEKLNSCCYVTQSAKNNTKNVYNNNNNGEKNKKIRKSQK